MRPGGNRIFPGFLWFSRTMSRATIERTAALIYKSGFAACPDELFSETLYELHTRILSTGLLKIPHVSDFTF